MVSQASQPGQASWPASQASQPGWLADWPASQASQQRQGKSRKNQKNQKNQRFQENLRHAPPLARDSPGIFGFFGFFGFFWVFPLRTSVESLSRTMESSRKSMESLRKSMESWRNSMESNVRRGESCSSQAPRKAKVPCIPLCNYLVRGYKAFESTLWFETLEADDTGVTV